MSYGRSAIVERPFADALAATRDALAGEGFGVLTEIDLAATLKKKLDVDIPPQVILGACNPPLAHRALAAEESIGLLLPCNVVVRQGADGRTIVETLDPQVMVTLTGNPELASVAHDAAERLARVLLAVQSPVT
jgi:uncharacterized protein (DUF302 family)